MDQGSCRQKTKIADFGNRESPIFFFNSHFGKSGIPAHKMSEFPDFQESGRQDP